MTHAPRLRPGRPSWTRFARAAALVALLGCTGTTLDGGTALDKPVAGEVSARCAAPHGTPELPATAASFASALAGRWLVCGHDVSSSSILISRSGIDFSVDGRWSLLKADGIGGYEHTIDDGTFGTYQVRLPGKDHLVAPTDKTPSSDLSLHLNTPSADLRVDFEVSPKRLVTHGTQEVDYVRLDNEPGEPVPYTSKEGELCAPVTMPCRAGLTCMPATLDHDGGVASLCAKAP